MCWTGIEKVAEILTEWPQDTRLIPTRPWLREIHLQQARRMRTPSRILMQHRQMSSCEEVCVTKGQWLHPSQVYFTDIWIQWWVHVKATACRFMVLILACCWSFTLAYFGSWFTEVDPLRHCIDLGSLHSSSPNQEVWQDVANEIVALRESPIDAMRDEARTAFGERFKERMNTPPQKKNYAVRS